MGNYIGVQDEPEIMFKKVMEVPDNLIIKYFELATDEHPDKIAEIKNDLENGKNPRDVKFELAKIITRLYHTEEETKSAIVYFENVFKQGNLPDVVPQMTIPPDCNMLKEIGPFLLQNNFVASNNEFRRLVNQGGVQINKEKVTDFDNTPIKNGDIIKLGKKKFVQIIKFLL